MTVTGWRSNAACRGEDTDMFFPGRGEWQRVQAAKAICAGCPVRDECLEESLVNGDRHGIFGGTSERERRLIRGARRRAARERALAVA